jgi:hypothetical protein
MARPFYAISNHEMHGGVKRVGGAFIICETRDMLAEFIGPVAAAADKP